MKEQKMQDVYVYVCDSCGATEDWGMTTCLGCGVMHCRGCMDTHGHLYHHAINFQGSGDGYYCNACDTKMTTEYAADVNSFWSGAEDVLDASNGDIFQAVARRAAGRLLGYLLDGYHQRGAVEVLSEQEGWPDKDHIGITIIDHDIPDLNAAMFEVEELAV